MEMSLWGIDMIIEQILLYWKNETDVRDSLSVDLVQRNRQRLILKSYQVVYTAPKRSDVRRGRV